MDIINSFELPSIIGLVPRWSVEVEVITKSQEFERFDAAMMADEPVLLSAYDARFTGSFRVKEKRTGGEPPWDKATFFLESALEK